MNRRELMTLFGGAAATTAWSTAAQAQQSTKFARIGFVGAAAADRFAERVEAFRAGLRKLGYQEGLDIVIECRSAKNGASFGRMKGQYSRLVCSAMRSI